MDAGTKCQTSVTVGQPFSVTTTIASIEQVEVMENPLGRRCMTQAVFVPHTERERKNVAALAEYLHGMYYC